MRGTAMALYFFAMYLLGASLGPYGTGMLSDHFARRTQRLLGLPVVSEVCKAEGLHSAMYAIPVLALLVGVVLFCASRTIEGDVRRRLASSPIKGPVSV